MLMADQDSGAYVRLICLRYTRISPEGSLVERNGQNAVELKTNCRRRADDTPPEGRERDGDEVRTCHST